jgi:Glycosyl transferase family 2
MECVKIFIFIFLLFLLKYSTNSDNSSDEKPTESPVIENILSDTELFKKPSVTIVSLIRNKAHTLPLFLTYLEGLEYPKERISLWFATDHNEDNSQEILEVWLKRVQYMYHSVHYQFDDSKKLRKGESNMTHWPEERFNDLIQMKEEALNHARNSWADFIFVCKIIAKLKITLN